MKSGRIYQKKKKEIWKDSLVYLQGFGGVGKAQASKSNPCLLAENINFSNQNLF